MLTSTQKAQISLARCLYEDADIYALDKAFGPMDRTTSNKIFTRVIFPLLNIFFMSYFYFRFLVRMVIYVIKQLSWLQITLNWSKLSRWFMYWKMGKLKQAEVMIKSWSVVKLWVIFWIRAGLIKSLRKSIQMVGEAWLIFNNNMDYLFQKNHREKL